MSLTVVVLAAGLGSRFGGEKQTTAVDDAGNTLLDYSVHDAITAGFDTVVCVIAAGMDEAFEARVGARLRSHARLVYAHQSLTDLPAGFAVPDGRVKPWGTAHAVLCALPYVDGPFVAINADDFYGHHAFSVMADYLSAPGEVHAMVGYRLVNTLSEHGSVSRGVCRVSDSGRLLGVHEHTAIRLVDGRIRSTQSAEPFSPDTVVSLNFWGFRPSAAAAFEAAFPAFLRTGVARDPLTAEFYLPAVADDLVDDPGVQVLTTPDRWMGLTYAADLPIVAGRLAALRAQGVYPATLWS